jgi:hypothetical protein
LNQLIRVDDPPDLKRLETLFLCTLFLYPFSAAGHSFYMIPQVSLLAFGLTVVPRAGTQNASLMKVAVCALAILSSSTPMLRELLAEHPDFLEPVKLLVNLSTVLLFLFLSPVFDPAKCARWLKRFAIVWLLIVVGLYIFAHTSTWEMLALLVEPEGMTSTHLYQIAEPLDPIFLTKNIMAMYAVAVFGAFLYFKYRARTRTTVAEKAIFFALIALLFSRQGLLAGVVLISLEYFIGKERAMRRWAIVIILITALAVGGIATFVFDLSSREDGATTRLDLWQLFFAHWSSYAFEGMGVHQMNVYLEPMSIDNFHMFFMNQIAAYGLVHCLAFNLLLTILAFFSLPKKIRWLLIAPYWMNVCFQTYGYEYGNLMLFCIAANSCNLRADQPAVRPRTQLDSAPNPLLAH